MSGFIRLNCPHCLTQNASMHYQGYWKNPKITDLHTIFYVCSICHKGICIELQSPLGVQPTHPSFNIFEKGMYKILQISPSPLLRIPNQIPEHIAKIFKQALMTVNNPLLADSTGSMCRKTLDRAITFIDKNNLFSEDKLQKRIDGMFNHGLITETLKDWAHIIRIDGNDAAHDEFTHVEAKQLFNFTEIFLIYVFTLPALITNAKATPEAELVLYAPFQVGE